MYVIELIEQQSPFIQSLISAAVFGATIWLARTILKIIGKNSSKFLNAYQYEILRRHWVHKEYVNSNNILQYTQGFNFVVLQALRFSLIGILIFVFFFGVSSIIASQWLWTLCSWFAFNSFYEAYQWAKDSSSEEHIKKIDDSIKKDFFEKLPSNKNVEVDKETKNS